MAKQTAYVTNIENYIFQMILQEGFCSSHVLYSELMFNDSPNSPLLREAI